MSFGQVSKLLLLGLNRFYIVLILRVPADKNICFAIKLVDCISFRLLPFPFPRPSRSSRMDIILIEVVT